MRLRDFFARRPEVRDEPRLEFLGEQDGPPERELKTALCQEFERHPAVQRAYLARIGFQPGRQPVASLCVFSHRLNDPTLVRAVGKQFAALFARSVPLDILFLTTEQESDLQRVCAPFYPPAV